MGAQCHQEYYTVVTCLIQLAALRKGELDSRCVILARGVPAVVGDLCRDVPLLACGFACDKRCLGCCLLIGLSSKLLFSECVWEVDGWIE